jgi:transcriptional antiterminator RfaH
MKWYAIYTKPRHEKPVASRLQDIGIEVLNPQLKSKKYKHNRLTEVTEPLFPCYLFAHFGKNKYSHLISYTRGVRYIIGKADPIAVHDGIIETIKDRMTDGNTVTAEARKFSEGDRVMISDGPFRNLQGIFESELKGAERVLILLDAIYYRLELDSCLLTKA